MSNKYFDDDVNGIIIGEITFPYEFWIYEKLHPHLPEHKAYYVNRRVDTMSFSNDKDAIEWFKERYPAEYATGKVEMRCFDKTNER